MRSKNLSSMFIIRTGGQTGVDRAALNAAMYFNGYNSNSDSISVIVTGWCPKGRIADDGIIELKYPLNETSNS